jgi:hypothetical protein
MTAPPSLPSLPCLLDLPLPSSSSPSDDSSFYLYNQERSTTPLASGDSGSCCPTNTGILAPILPRLACSYIRMPSDPEANTHDADTHTFDSIFMSAPPSLPSLPCLLDLPSPPSSPQSSTSLLYFSHQMRPAIPPTCADSHSFSPEDISTRTLNFHGLCMLMFSILSDLDVTTPNADSQIFDSSLSPQASTSECLCDSQRMDR